MIKIYNSKILIIEGLNKKTIIVPYMLFFAEHLFY
jgi:hypothetical protein